MGSFNQREVAPFHALSQTRSICLCLLVTAAVVSVIYLTLSVMSRYQLFMYGPASTTSGYNFDCLEGAWNWRRGWSQQKKAYCCEHSGTGCEARPSPPVVITTTTARPLPVTTTRPPPVTTRPVATTRPPATPAPAGCDTKCNLNGKIWSCKDRMQWAVSNEYLGRQDACQLAYTDIVGKCPACNACPLPTLLASSVCKAPTARPAGGCNAVCGMNGKSASCTTMIKAVANTKYSNAANKCSRAYGEVLAQCSMCAGCPLSQTGCQVPSAATNPGPATASEPFDCDAGFSNWQAGWSIPKKTWCCVHRQRGCQ